MAEARLAQSYIQQSPSNFVPWEVDNRVHERYQINADPPPHALSFQKESFKSVTQDSAECDSQLCCWLLSLLLILQDKVMPHPLLQEKRKCFDPLFFHCGCPAVHGQCSTTRGMRRARPKGQHADPRSTPSQTQSVGHPMAPPFSLGMGHGSPPGSPPPAGTQHHEQPREHCLLLLQPVEQPPVGGHTPRLNTAPVPPPPPAMAYTQVTKHILALGALVLTLLPGRDPTLLNPALAVVSPTLNPEPDFTRRKTCRPFLPTQLCPKDGEDAA